MSKPADPAKLDKGRNILRNNPTVVALNCLHAPVLLALLDESNAQGPLESLQKQPTKKDMVHMLMVSYLPLMLYITNLRKTLPTPPTHHNASMEVVDEDRGITRSCWGMTSWRNTKSSVNSIKWKSQCRWSLWPTMRSMKFKNAWRWSKDLPGTKDLQLPSVRQLMASLKQNSGNQVLNLFCL